MIIIVKDIANCIMELHKHGIYHSDIKPGNIAFWYNGEKGEYFLKLIDFGGTVTNFIELSSYTRFYFFNCGSRSSFYQLGGICFLSRLDRLKVEFYSLAISLLLMILVSEEIYNIFSKND